LLQAEQMLVHGLQTSLCFQVISGHSCHFNWLNFANLLWDHFLACPPQEHELEGQLA
jgi:hypothetical protein